MTDDIICFAIPIKEPLLSVRAAKMRISRAKIGSSGLEDKNRDNPENSGGLVSMHSYNLHMLTTFINDLTSDDNIMQPCIILSLCNIY